MGKHSLIARYRTSLDSSIKAFIITCLLMIINNQISYSQASVVWQYIDSNQNEEGRLVLTDVDNNIWTIWYYGNITKLNHFGDTIFTMIADPENYQSVFPIKAKFDNQENLVVVLNGYDMPNTQYYEIVKIDLAGNQLWKLKVVSPDPILIELQIAEITIDDNDNIYVTGSNGTQHWSYFYSAMVSSDGILMWENNYNSPIYHTHTGSDIAVFDSNNIYATGHHNEASNKSDAVIIKYNNLGETVWIDSFNYWEYFVTSYGATTNGIKIETDNLNNVYMLAACLFRQVIIKYDPSGVRQWIIIPDSNSIVSYENMLIEGNAIYISTGRMDQTYLDRCKKV